MVECLAGACLSTTFVWGQHGGAVRRLAASRPSPLADVWLWPLCRGERRGGVALGGLIPGPSPLHARPGPDGWVLDGTSPWVTGWGLLDIRAALPELAVRAATALVVSSGSRSILAGEHPQRLAREALFLLVFGSRPLVKTGLLNRLGARRAEDADHQIRVGA